MGIPILVLQKGFGQSKGVRHPDDDYNTKPAEHLRCYKQQTPTNSSGLLNPRAPHSIPSSPHRTPQQQQRTPSADAAPRDARRAARPRARHQRHPPVARHPLRIRREIGRHRLEDLLFGVQLLVGGAGVALHRDALPHPGARGGVYQLHLSCRGGGVSNGRGWDFIVVSIRLSG